MRPEDPSGGEATAPNWATGGGGGSMGGFGGDSALSRPDRCANGAMDVVVDNNGDDGAAFTARRVCHRAEELPSRGTGRELGGEHSGGGSAGDEAGGGNVGGEDGWGSGGHSVAAVGWAAVGSAADVSARGTSFAGSDMETQRI